MSDPTIDTNTHTGTQKPGGRVQISEGDPKSLAGALVAFRLSNMNAARRCMARTRRGTPCQCPATTGRGRCRLHGGAKGSGGPKRERNGVFKAGAWTGEAVALRRAAGALVKAARRLRLEC